MVNHNSEANNYGICVKETDNTIVYFNKLSGSFTHLPISLFNTKYYKRNIKHSELKDWIIFINNNTEKYRIAKHNISYNKLKDLSKYLINELNDELNITINTNEICPICLFDYKIGDKMISFHKDHQKHVCCLECFTKYKDTKCPICRT